MKRKFAIPTAGGRLCAHFGHCEQFAILEVDGDTVVGEAFVEPPVHQPGTYPRFLAQQGVTVVLAGGMGTRAQQLFQASGIEVLAGVGPEAPRTLVEQFLRDELTGGANLCDHGRHGRADHRCEP